jgi:hypothetical protein
MSNRVSVLKWANPKDRIGARSKRKPHLSRQVGFSFFGTPFLGSFIAPKDRDRYEESAGGSAGWRTMQSDSVLSLFFGGCRTIVAWGLIRNPILFSQPATQIDDPASLRAEWVIRVFLPVSRHRPFANRTSHLIHRFLPTRTSGISPLTQITGQDLS